MTRNLFLLSAALLVASCKSGGPAPEGTTADKAEAKQTKPTEPLLTYTGFATPESVQYDAEADVYLVSNINGSPLEKDGNGFISRLSPSGEIIDLKWIDGESSKVDLNAPKGLAINGDELWVTDIDVMRVFDRKTGKPLGQTLIPGATFLNDVIAGPDGAIFFSDSGLTGGADGFEDSGADAVYRFAPRKRARAVLRRATLHKGAHLGRPNGIAVEEDTVYVVTFGSGELHTIVGHDVTATQKLPMGGLDGVVLLHGGVLLVSSWAGSKILAGLPGGVFVPLIHGVDAPADIGYDTKRHRILVPLFNDNTVKVFRMPRI